MKNKGFTLLEILIALFIFTIVSIMLVGGLHGVINAQSGTERSAERLRTLQLALLLMGRDIEQTVNRPITNAGGSQEAAFMGSPTVFVFTHIGAAGIQGGVASSSIERVRYSWHDQGLWRNTWDMVDQAPSSLVRKRELLSSVDNAQFQYLDNKGKWQSHWPSVEETNQPLPRAVRITLTLSQWGSITQTYVIAAQIPTTTASTPPPSDTEPP